MQTWKYIAQCFSNFRVHLNHLIISLKCRLFSVCLGQGLRFCIYDKLLGDANAAGSRTTLEWQRHSSSPSGTILWLWKESAHSNQMLRRAKQRAWKTASARCHHLSHSSTSHREHFLSLNFQLCETIFLLKPVKVRSLSITARLLVKRELFSGEGKQKRTRIQRHQV